jgi:hypothetical protein
MEQLKTDDLEILDAYYRHVKRKTFLQKEFTADDADGWLTADGTIFKCDSSEHDSCALYICSLLISNPDFLASFGNNLDKAEVIEFLKISPPRFLLRKLGFVQVSMEKCVLLGNTSPLNDVQKAAIKKVGFAII